MDDSTKYCSVFNLDSSETVGFGGASYYCETFKKYYGMPPLIYKRNQPAGLLPSAINRYFLSTPPHKADKNVKI